jgi:hypothetical protein
MNVLFYYFTTCTPGCTHTRLQRVLYQHCAMSRGVFLELKLETEVWNEEQRTRRVYVLYYRVLLPGALTTCQCMSCVLHTQSHSGT